MGTGVSVWGDEKVLEVDDGEGCTIMRRYFMPHSLKRVCVCVCVCILPQSQKEQQKEKSYLDQTLFPSVLARTFCFGSLRMVCLGWMWLVYPFRGDKC